MIRLRANGTAIPTETFAEMAARFKAAAENASDILAEMRGEGLLAPRPNRLRLRLPLFKRGPDDPDFYDNAETIEAGE